MNTDIDAAINDIPEAIRKYYDIAEQGLEKFKVDVPNTAELFLVYKARGLSAFCATAIIKDCSITDVMTVLSMCKETENAVKPLSVFTLYKRLKGMKVATSN